MRRHLVKSGTLVVSVPAMSNTDGWLESVEVEYPSAEFDDDEYASEAQSLHFYRVIDNVKPVQG